MMPSSGTMKSPFQTSGHRALKIHARTRKMRGAIAAPKASRHPNRIIASLLLGAHGTPSHASGGRDSAMGSPFSLPISLAAMRTLVTAYDVEAVRACFPALRRRVDDRPVAWLDGPAGTQVPEACIDAMRDYLVTSSSNTHGAFAASAETDALVTATRAGMADLLGTTNPDEIAFGPNMTTITFALS